MLASLKGVSMIFTDPRTGKGLVALNDVSLGIEAGEFICLIGPSGCGKSAVLNLLAGFQRPVEGKVEFRGEEVKAPSSQRGVVFQEFSLYPWMNVLQNVVFSLQTNNMASKEKDERAMRYLEMVGLQEFAQCRPDDLSGGMKQRVAIARTLAMDPDLLLMDEPFGSLDEQTRKKLDREVLDIWKRGGKTVIFVTHNIEEALLLGSRVVLMSASPGRINRTWDIDIPHPRDPLDPRFATVKKEMSRQLQVCSCTMTSHKGFILIEDENNEEQ